jgi:hypothetical protein
MNRARATGSRLLRLETGAGRQVGPAPPAAAHTGHGLPPRVRFAPRARVSAAAAVPPLPHHAPALAQARQPNNAPGDPRAAAVAAAVRVIPDFPRPGVAFSDISSLLLQPAAFQHAIDLLTERYAGMGVECVAGAAWPLGDPAWAAGRTAGVRRAAAPRVTCGGRRSGLHPSWRPAPANARPCTGGARLRGARLYLWAAAGTRAARALCDAAKKGQAARWGRCGQARAWPCNPRPSPKRTPRGRPCVASFRVEAGRPATSYCSSIHPWQPGRTVSETYTTEYSSDTIEMQAGAVQPGQRVLLVRQETRSAAGPRLTSWPRAWQY